MAIGCGILAAGSSSALYYQIRKRKKAKSEAVTEETGLYEPPKEEGWLTDTRGPLSPKEMSHSPIQREFEMPNTVRVELPGDIPPYPELYGSDSRFNIRDSPLKKI